MPDWIVPALSLCLSACLPVPLSVCDACGCGRVCLFVCLVLRRIMSYVSLCVCTCKTMLRSVQGATAHLSMLPNEAARHVGAKRTEGFL